MSLYAYTFLWLYSGRIATHTPLLLVGLDGGSSEDVAERLKVSKDKRSIFDNPLSKAGTQASLAARPRFFVALKSEGKD